MNLKNQKTKSKEGRNMKNRAYYMVVVLSMILLIGCASTGAIHATMLVTAKLSNYKTMLFNVSSQVPESGEAILQLESMTVAKLREKGLFEKVITGSASPDASVDLRLNAKIVELSKVSSGSRVIFGALSGRAGTVVDVELIDMKTGKSIGAFKAEGKSSGGTAFAGTTSQSIERAVEQIVEFIQKNW